MSHFITAVLLPSTLDSTDERAVEAYLAEVLAPYDENKQVDPYARPCYCVGHAAKMRVLGRMGEAADPGKDKHERAHIVDRMQEFYQIYQRWIAAPKVDYFRDDPDDLAPAQRALYDLDHSVWEALCDLKERVLNALVAAEPDATNAEVTCDVCHGSGVEQCTYNPDSKWDWYQVGGRWDGFFGDDGARSNVVALRAHRAVVGASMKRAAYAYVTLTGQWAAKGEMGWFGISHDAKEQDAWQAQLLALLDASLLADPDAQVVAVDLHI